MFFFFSSRRRHTRSFSAFLLNRSSDLKLFQVSSLMLLLVWLIFFMVLIKLLPILGTISGKTVKLMVLALIRSEERRVGKECRYRWSPYQKKKKKTMCQRI